MNYKFVNFNTTHFEKHYTWHRAKVGASTKIVKKFFAGALAALCAVSCVAGFGAEPVAEGARCENLGAGAVAQIAPRADDEVFYTTSAGVAVKKQNNTLYTQLGNQIYAVLGQGDGGSTYYVDGYIQKEYLEGTGTQWIDTDVLITSDFDLELQFWVNSVGAQENETPIGGRDRYAGGGGWLFHVKANQVWFQGWNGPSDSGLTAELWSGAVYDQIVTYQWYGNTFVVTTPTGSRTTSVPTILDAKWATLTFFTYEENNTGTPQIYAKLTSGKLYYCKFWKGGTLIRDFVPVQCPCKKSVGLYDKVNKVLYENKGTGTFGVGPNAVPEEVANAQVYDNFSYASDNLAEGLSYRTVEGFEYVGGVEKGYLLCQGQESGEYMKLRI